MQIPLAYLITFTCYGTRLRGDEHGSVDRDHNVPGTDFLPPDPSRVWAQQERMNQEACILDREQRELVLDSIRNVCAQRAWGLWAVHVRSTHTHLVVAAPVAPERILNDVKAYASRALNRANRRGADRRRWARHGSTRYLWKPENVRAAIQYVVREQGKPMAVWEKGGPLADARGSDTSV